MFSLFPTYFFDKTDKNLKREREREKTEGKTKSRILIGTPQSQGPHNNKSSSINYTHQFVNTSIHIYKKTTEIMY